MSHIRKPTRRTVLAGALATAALGAGTAGVMTASADPSETTTETMSPPDGYRLEHRYHMDDRDELVIYDNPDREPPPDDQGPRLPSNVTMEEGEIGRFVRVHTRLSEHPSWGKKKRWASGGFKLRDSAHRYGLVRAVLRLSASHGARGVALYWPERENSWPELGELDYYEFGADVPGRQRYKITNHFKKDGSHGMEHSGWIRADFQDWHVLEVEWRPGRWDVRIPGAEPNSWHTQKHVPSEPMFLAMQTALGAVGDHERTPTMLDIAKVELWVPEDT